MTRSVKNIATNSSSEIISSADSDSDSSSSIESSSGSGDEGVPSSNEVTTQSKATDAATSPCNPLTHAKFFLGLACPSIAIIGTILLIVSGIDLNNAAPDERVGYSGFFALGGTMMAAGVIGTFLACTNPTSSSLQGTNA
jgi:hypothetical protein